MKTLLVLALLGLGLGAAFWKTQNPDATIDELGSQAASAASRLKGGFVAARDAVRDSGPKAAAEAEALSNRLDSLESELQNALSSAEALVIQGRLTDTERRLDASDTLQSSFQQSLDGVGTSVDMLTDDLQRLNAASEADVVRLDAIDSRLELVIRRLDEQTTDEDLQALQGTVSTLEQQIDEMQRAAAARSESLGTELAGISERTDVLIGRLDTLAAGNAGGTDQGESEGDLSAFSAGIDQRFSSLETKLETVNTDSRRIAALTKQLNAARMRIGELEKRDNSAEQALAELSSSIGELRTAGESLSIDTVQKEIREQLAQVQSQVETDAGSGNIEALNDLLNATRDRIQALEQRVQDLPATSSAADNAQQTQSALESQIAALERRLESLPSDVNPALVNSITDVQQQVDQLSARGFLTQDDLKAQQAGKTVEYKIYFDRNSASITEDAANVLNSFITQEKNRTTGVSIFGFTDRRGPALYNQQLALQRATNVRSYLIQNGLDYTKIMALSGLGEDAAAAILPDNAEDAQQRVVVLYAAQP